MKKTTATCPSCDSDSRSRRLTPYATPTTSCFDPWHDARPDRKTTRRVVFTPIKEGPSL